jgi:hypothetical protein
MNLPVLIVLRECFLITRDFLTVYEDPDDIV